MYAVGASILVMHGSFVGNVKKITLTQEMVKESLYSQNKIKLFGDIKHAELYAKSLREERANYDSPRHRKKIVPIFAIEVKASANIDDLFTLNITQTDNYTNSTKEYTVEFAVITSNDISKIFNARFFEEDQPIIDFTPKIDQDKSSGKCTLI